MSKRIVLGTILGIFLIIMYSIFTTSVYAMYLPTMPPGSGIFGKAIEASPSFQNGYHWDDLATPQDDREDPGHYSMPSPMSGYTAGDALDWHWVFVSVSGDYVVWDFGASVYGVRVYPSQDHGPYVGLEFDEFDVYGSNDKVAWSAAIQVALYYEHDEVHMMTHDGVKDYNFGGAQYRYIKVQSNAIGGEDYEIDAVEALPQPPVIPPPKPVGGYAYLIEGHTATQPLTPYLALIAILMTGFTAVRRKTHRRTK